MWFKTKTNFLLHVLNKESFRIFKTIIATFWKKTNSWRNFAHLIFIGCLKRHFRSKCLIEDPSPPCKDIEPSRSTLLIPKEKTFCRRKSLNAVCRRVVFIISKLHYNWPFELIKTFRSKKKNTGFEISYYRWAAFGVRFHFQKFQENVI